MRLPLLASLSLLLLVLGVAGCGAESTPEVSPSTAMAQAKSHLDEAASVHLELSTDGVPKQGDGVLAADGVLTHQPAFKGTVKVLLSGISASVPVVSVDGQMHAQLPLQTGYAVIDPAEYGAPDPATFADKDAGISSLVTQLTDLKQDGRSRAGEVVLTTYRGTLPGAPVSKIIPSARENATYATTVGVDEDGRAVKVSITGPFFQGTEDVTFDVVFDDYDKDTTITAP